MSKYDHLNPLCCPLVRVDWEDIVFNDRWDGGSEDVQPVECWTVGWLLEDSETMIVVAGSYNWRESAWATVHSFSKVVPVVSVEREVRDVEDQ